jgi:hypothetical protein
MQMKKLLIHILIILLLPLGLFGFAPIMPGLPTQAMVKMIGVIPPREIQIFVTDDLGNELSAEDAVLNFDFPETEEWEVSQSIRFYYSSHLPKEKIGWLAFRIEDMDFENRDALQVSLELESSNSQVTESVKDTFQIVFEETAQDNAPIGRLTVRIQKKANAYFSPGPFTGLLSMSYIEGN